MPNSVKSTTAEPVSNSRRVRVSILIAVGLFILALVVSAVFVPQLRLLHFLQALIYIAVIVLTRRNSPWGFGAAVVVATAWNSLNLFITHLFQAGAAQLWLGITTGHVTRPDTMMVFVGSIAHFILIIACITGFLELRPGRKQWGQFFGGGVLVLAYFALIIVIAAPR